MASPSTRTRPSQEAAVLPGSTGHPPSNAPRTTGDRGRGPAMQGSAHLDEVRSAIRGNGRHTSTKERIHSIFINSVKRIDSHIRFLILDN